MEIANSNGDGVDWKQEWREAFHGKFLYRLNFVLYQCLLKEVN